MKENNRLFMDIHVLQTIPPANVNRDDTGSPKTARYGGVKRARVSSQSWKRAMRRYFNEFGGEENVGVRTKDIVVYVAKKIGEMSPQISEEEAMAGAEEVINKAGIKTKDQKAKALVFLGNHQAEALARAAVEKNLDKALLQEMLKGDPDIDIALFGRMVADDPSLNEDASAQIAHAISTHAVQTEFDYYTAMDDLSPEDQAGAGMLGNIEFNSSMLYRYGNVAVHEFSRQINDKQDFVNAMKLFIEAFSNSLPTGKINTFANQTLPQMLVVTFRKDRPVNLISAYENPVKSESGYARESVKRFADEFVKTQKFVGKPLASFYVTTDLYEGLESIGEEKDSLDELLRAVGDQLSNYPVG